MHIIEERWVRFSKLEYNRYTFSSNPLTDSIVLTLSPRKSSGAIQNGVPRAFTAHCVPSGLYVASSSERNSPHPKSATFARNLSSTKMLCDFRSPWRTTGTEECRKRSPLAMSCSMLMRKSRSRNMLSLCKRSCREPYSMYSTGDTESWG